MLWVVILITGNLLVIHAILIGNLDGFEEITQL
jgi:hypothetical protein